MSKSHSSSSLIAVSRDEGGSFVTGFTVGLLAGAAGFYLFGTKDGAGIRKKVVTEWDKVKQNVLQELLEEEKTEAGANGMEGGASGPTTLGDLAELARQKIMSVLDGMEKMEKVEKVSGDRQKKNSSVGVKKPSTASKKLFKGV